MNDPILESLSFALESDLGVEEVRVPSSSPNPLYSRQPLPKNSKKILPSAVLLWEGAETPCLFKGCAFISPPLALKENKEQFLAHLLAEHRRPGTGSYKLTLGLFGFIVGHPIDTVKVHQQLRDATFLKSTRRIYKRHGFFQGMSLPCVTYGAGNAVFFGVYGPTCEYLEQRRLAAVKNKLPPHHDDVNYGEMFNLKEATVEGATLPEAFAAGCVAGAVQITFTAPIELIKIKLQSPFPHPNYKGPFSCFLHVYKSSGLSGFYRGFWALAIRDVPGSGIWVTSYEYLKEALHIEGHYRSVTQAVAGGCAGVIAWFFVIPVDVVKSRLQADNPAKPYYRNGLHCASEILKEKGVRGLFRGFWSASLRAFPVNAAAFLAYQFFLDDCKRKK